MELGRKAAKEAMTFALPPRRGRRPATTPTNPHTQLDQRPPARVIAELAENLFALPGVREKPSAISVPGARALWLEPGDARGPREAFLIGREFAHVHPLPDGSLHVALPPSVAQDAIAQGWAVVHPVALLAMGEAGVALIALAAIAALVMDQVFEHFAGV